MNKQKIKFFNCFIGAIILFDGLFRDKESLFKGNSAQDGCTSYLLNAAESYYSGSIFMNEIAFKAGLFVIKELSLLVMGNITFEVI